MAETIHFQGSAERGWLRPTGQPLSQAYAKAAFFLRVHLATREVPQYAPCRAPWLALVPCCPDFYRKAVL